MPLDNTCVTRSCLVNLTSFSVLMFNCQCVNFYIILRINAVQCLDEWKQVLCCTCETSYQTGHVHVCASEQYCVPNNDSDP